MYRAKAIEITEETALLYVKACCRCGSPGVALRGLTDPAMRVGLWASAPAWNYLLARLDTMALPAAVGEASVSSAFAAMKGAGVPPNKHTYHLVARALLAAGSADEARAVAEAAKGAGELQDSTAAMVAAGQAGGDPAAELASADPTLADEAALPPAAFAK